MKWRLILSVIIFVFVILLVTLLAVLPLPAHFSGATAHASSVPDHAGCVPSRAADARTVERCEWLGPGPGVITETDGDTPGTRYDYWENWDGTVDNGYCWDITVLEEPFYGAFAEGYLGPAQVHGIRAYLTSVYWQPPFDDLDLYIWGAGIDGPGCVLAMSPRALFEPVPSWPEVAPFDFYIEATVGPFFYVGLWDRPRLNGCPFSWYIAADEDGPNGDPWTCIGPGWGYPTGWQTVDVVFPSCVSLGLGVYTSGSASVEELPGEGRPVVSPTWGGIKALFRR